MLNGIPPSKHVFESIKPFTASSDATFANLEIPLTTSTTKTQRKTAQELKARNQWILKADPKHSPFLKAAGISIVSLANNHAMDYGSGGLSQMITDLDTEGIVHAGAGNNSNIAAQPGIIELSNKKKAALLSVMGFLTRNALLKTSPATLDTAGVAVLSTGGRLDQAAKDKLSRWISAAHKQADYVVVGIHWGVERKNLPTPYQVALGRALIDAGADIVWGNHPHVLQGAELYNGHLIMYSMGNLISNLPAVTGMLQVKIADDRTQSAEFIPAVNRHGRIVITEGKAKESAIREMRNLCRLLLRRYPSTVSVPAL